MSSKSPYHFLIKAISIVCLAVLLLELLCRLMVDPLVYGALDLFNVKKQNLPFAEKIIDRLTIQNTDHLDYVFVGSSRIPASINPQVLVDIKGGNAVNAGRGHTTPFTHYQALRYRLDENPDLIAGGQVFLEVNLPWDWTGSLAVNKYRIFEKLEDGELTESAPQILVPYLSLSDINDIWSESPITIRSKIDLTLMKISALYRCVPYINENFNKLVATSGAPDISKEMVETGGIRNDIVQEARDFARVTLEQTLSEIEDYPELNDSILQSSVMNSYLQMVRNAQSQLYILELPTPPIYSPLNEHPKTVRNRRFLYDWLSMQGVKVIRADDFVYTAADFPDYWHLAIERRDEFTQSILESIQ